MDAPVWEEIVPLDHQPAVRCVLQGEMETKCMHEQKKDAFNMRMQLEQTFRKTLQEVSTQYHQQAFEEMTRESKNALLEQAKLKEELALQNVGIESLMARHESQAGAHKEVIREKELLEQATKAPAGTGARRTSARRSDDAPVDFYLRF